MSKQRDHTMPSIMPESPMPAMKPPAVSLHSMNELVIQMVGRRIRELLTEGQRVRADGNLTVRIDIMDGVCTKKLNVSPSWNETLGR